MLFIRENKLYFRVIMSTGIEAANKESKPIPSGGISFVYD
jgi:hypothetical protein